MIRLSTGRLWELLLLFAVFGYMAGRLFRHAAITRLQNRVGRLHSNWTLVRDQRDFAVDRCRDLNGANGKLTDELQFTRDECAALQQALVELARARAMDRHPAGSGRPFDPRNLVPWSGDN